jgi:hypothetical protein
MRGGGKDTIWLLLGVMLLFGVMATFSPGSTFGKAFISLRQNLENVFGGEVGYCPFINPYAMSIYSAGELVITGAHPLCEPTQTVLSECVAGSSSCNNGPVDHGVNGGDPACDGYIYSISLLAEGDTNLVNVSWESTGDVSYREINSDFFFSSLATIQQDAMDKSNKVAVQLLTEKRPAWQCFFIFGLLPFFITYYLINDILTFAYLRTNTRRLIAIFAALLAILTGAFANIIVAVASFVGLSIGQSFLMAIFSLAILSVFLGQITVTAGVAQTTVNAVQKAVTGALVLRNVADATSQQNKQE